MATLVAGIVVGVVSTPDAASANASSAPAPAALDCSGDNYAPSTRDVVATKIIKSSGGVTDTSTPTSLPAGSSITVDFGKEMGGTLTLAFGAVAAGTTLNVAFNESLPNVNGSSDWNYPASSIQPTANSTWTSPERGGFRYVTLSVSSAGSVDISKVTTHNDFDPGRGTLNQYPNTFCSSDDLLNKIWYAGAYTVQTDTLPSTVGFDGASLIGPTTSNGAPLPVLTDGAKRDRMVWVGDLSVELATAYSALGDMAPTRNSLIDEYSQQLNTGQLPYSGQAGNDYWSLQRSGSETYSMWGVIDTANYVRYSGDLAFANSYWSQYVRALDFSLNHVSTTNGLMTLDPNQTSDWARGDNGGQNVEANELLYEVLVTGSQLAAARGDTSDAATWTADAASLKTAINRVLWNAAAGEYQDNTTNSTLFPQDGNSLALLFGIADATRAAQITSALQSQVTSIGAETPELNDGNGHDLYGTFPASMEVEGLLSRGYSDQAEALMRTEWGYMLHSAQSTGSTLWEGMDTNGNLNYGEGGSATSASHGWASGPTSALTFYMLGIRPDAASLNGDYTIAPNSGTVGAAKGSLTTPSGVINQSWTKSGATFTDTYSAPANTVSSIAVPMGDAAALTAVTVNGVPVWAAGKPVGSSYQPTFDATSDTLTLTGAPASATVVVGPQLWANPSTSPSSNAAGWIKGSGATVNWGWSDSSSFTSSASNCPPSTKVTAPFNGTVSATCTDSTGQTVTASQDVKLDNTAPTAAPELQPRPASSGWSGGAVTVDWNWSDTASGIVPATCPRTSSVSTPGVSTVTASCTDVAGNSATAAQVVKIDTGAPSASPSQFPPANGNGWTQPDASGNVTVKWAWSNAGGSGLMPSSASLCPATTVVNQAANTSSATPGVHTIYVDCANTVGRAGHATQTVKIDGDPPVDSPQVVPGQSGGWVSNPGPVSVKWQWTDAVSGNDTSHSGCPTSTPVLGSGTRTVSSTCRDLAGNTATDTITLHIDQTPPASSPTVVGGVVQWRWVDPESGLGSNCTSSSALPVGGGTAIATCFNNAGRYAIATYKNTDTGSVSGTITDATTGKPVSGACVAVTTATSSALQSCADANGNYAVTGLAAGSYTMTASDPAGRHLATSKSVTATTGANSKVNMALVPVGTGNITGTIIDTSGNPAPDVCLYLVGYTAAQDAALPQLSTCTDANGNYEFSNVPAGTYRGFLTNQGSPVLRYGYPMFTNPGHNSNGGSGDLVVPNGNQTLSGINATMQPFVYGTLTGTVTDDAGTGLAGVHVNIYSSGYPQLLYTTTTNVDGSYTIQLPDNWANYDVQFLDPSGTHQPNQVGNFTVVGKQINTLNATLRAIG